MPRARRPATTSPGPKREDLGIAPAPSVDGPRSPDGTLRSCAALGVSAVSFAAYWLTHGTGPYWQDAGLFHAGLKLGGGLASPGYPLYVLLGRPFVAAFHLVLPHRTFAEAVNTFSALWAALAAGLVTLSALLLLTPGYRCFADASAERPRPGRLSGAAWAASILAGLMAGLSYSLWFQALTAEAYTLNAFFAVLILFLLLRLGAEGRLGRAPTPLQRRLVIAIFVAHGLSYGNHPATIMFVPLLALLVWRERLALHDRRLLGAAIVAYGLSGLAPYAYLPWAARAHPTLLSSQLGTWKGLADYVTGAQWTSHEASYGWSSSRLADFPLQLFHELFVVGLVGAALGLYRIFKDQPGLVPYLVVFTSVAWLLPILYLQGGEYDFWLLPLYMELFILAAVGCDWLLRWMSGARGSPLRQGGAAALLGAAALAPEIAVNAPLVDRRTDHVAEDFARNLYRHVDENGVLFASSDQECALTYYEEHVNGLRPDVIVIDAPMLGSSWSARWLKRRHPALKVPEELLSGPPRTPDESVEALILANLRERTFYISKRPKVALPEGLSWVPAGGLWKLDARGAKEIDPADWEYVYRNPSPFDRPARDHSPRKPLDPVTGEPLPLARTEREPYTAQIKRFHLQAWKNLGDWHYARNAFREAADAYGRLFAMDPSVDLGVLLLAMGKSLFAIDRYDEALSYLGRVSGRTDDRGNAEALLYMGQIYAAQKRPDLALAAFRSVKRLSPELWRSYAPALKERGLVGSEDP